MRAVNLIPAEQRGGGSVGAGRSGGAAYVVLGVVALVALMALLYGHARHQLTNRTAEAASLQQRAQAAQERATQLAPYTSFVALKQQRAAAVETLVDSRFDWAHTMHEFGRVLPAGVSLTSLVGTIGSASGSTSASTSASSASGKGGASVASATPPGSVPSFAIVGCATSQDTVATMLNRLRLMDGVATVQLQSATRASSGGASGGSGGCSGANFAAQITYQPLPAASAVAAAASTPVPASAAASGGSTSKVSLR